MVRLIKYPLFFLFLSGITSLSIAATYYVDNQATGNNDGTSWENAWESFGDINWSLIGPGNTIYISGGTNSKIYNETLNVGSSGTSGNSIVITKGNTPNHNGTVIFDGENTMDHGIYLNGESYVTIQYLTLQDFIDDGAIFIDYATGVVVKNTEIRAAGHGGIFIQRSSSCTIQNNTITTPSNTSRQTDGIYSQRNTSNTYKGNSIIISNQNINPHCDGIQLYEDNNMTIRNNYVEQRNNKSYNAQGIYATDCYGTFVVYNNVVYCPNTDNSLLTVANYASGRNAILIAYHNTLVGSCHGSIWIKDSPNSIIKNNVLVSYRNNAAVYKVEGSLPTPDRINYNVCYTPNSIYACDGNVFTYSQWRGMGYDANSIFDDPILKNMSDRQFQLQAGSPAIDAGVALGSSYNRDKNGTLRPQGTGWDMGAYESTEETISKPGAPSGETTPIQSLNYTYTTSGATSSMGHTIEYSFNWGDGFSSSWSTSTSASHTWTNPGTKTVTVTARCQTHPDKSNTSDGLSVNVQETPSPPSDPANLRIG